MTIAILATGDEIVHGDTLNTNSHQIAHTLSSEGLPLSLQLSCSDKMTDIIACLHFLSQKNDIIILIGGLGPTTDDLTRFALAEFINEPLVQHEKALEHINNRLKTANLAINQGNLQQCLFPEQAQLLPNPHGTAVGACIRWNNKLFFLLPGPPRECLPMFNMFALPLLQQTGHSHKQILKWQIFGAAESEIGQILENALANLGCQTGYRLETPYIEFKVRCTGDLVAKVQSIVDPLLKSYIISTPEQKASDRLRELILTLNEPITITDVVTGGLLQTLLDRPETHHLINFHQLNQNKLSFHLSGLEDYWTQQQATGQTQLVIHYSNHQQEGGETHFIPFRSSLVVFYAAEWLSFRLFHLINQLH